MDALGHLEQVPRGLTLASEESLASSSTALLGDCNSVPAAKWPRLPLAPSPIRS